LAAFDRAAYVSHDPVEFVRQFRSSPRDAELVGLLASSLAFGRVEMIRGNIRAALQVLGEGPAARVSALGRAGLREALRGFQHRWTTADDLADLLFSAGEIQAQHGTLGEFAARAFAARSGLRGALSVFSAELRRAARGTATGSFANLIPDPDKGSACKRLLLYARWMIRPDDGVDLGLWKIPPSALVTPVDTHIARLARYIGLTERADASWRTAEEITASFRRLDPEDPVKYDFALCHLGISGACPKRRQADICAGCPIRAVCRLS
jgi:uncharacterized protein (TIGR02757 family)